MTTWRQDKDLIIDERNLTVARVMRVDGAWNNAALAVRAVNCHEDLLDLCKHMQARLFVHEGNSELYDEATAIIAKATQ